MKLGYIGLGNMGRPMAARLVESEHALVVYNRTPSKAAGLVAAGATLADSPAELASSCDVTMLCLLTPAVCEEMLMGAGGVIASAPAGSLIIDFSTNGPDTARRCFEAAAKRRVGFLDAPVSGGPVGAAAGTLAIMAGGEDTDFQRALPVLRLLGANIHHMGAAGSGSVAKLMNQVILGATLGVICEAFVVATKYGLDPQQLYNLLMGSSSAGRVMERNVGSMILKRNFDPQFAVDLLAKDLGLATDLARQTGVRMLLGTVAELFVRESQARGLGGRDMAAVVRPLEEVAGVEVKPRGGKAT